MLWWFWWLGSGPSLYVSEAGEDDLPALAEIHEASFPHGWDADTLHRMIGGGMFALVAKRQGGVDPLGFVLVRAIGDEAEIITVATAPVARGRGVGRALMDEAIRRLQRDRVARLFLEVSERNAAALALYRALGFRQVGERKAYYASQVEPRKGSASTAKSASKSNGKAGGKPGVAGTTSPPLNAPPSALVMELDLR